jgi:hypothetical protein
MPETQIASLGSLVTSLESGEATVNTETLNEMAAMIAAIFGVDRDEVAVLQLVPRHKALKFVIPEKLTPVGTIPLTSTSALAARTARDRKAEIINNFSTARHANVFEAVPLGRDPGELIQKIMSVPILDGSKVHGVMQISRKARSLAAAGADFTQRDLRSLTSLSPVLNRFLKFCPAE